MKTRVSIFNDELVEKPKIEASIHSYLKEEYFPKFSDLCLLYIFYYMTRDILQVYAGQQLYKNGWKFHVNYQIWFKKGTKEDDVFVDSEQESEEKEENGKVSTEFMIYFNPLEWRNEKYVFGPLEEKDFLPSTEVEEYVKKLKGTLVNK